MADVKINLGGIWLTSFDMEVLRTLKQTRGWAETWRVLGCTSGYVEEKLRTLNLLTGERLWASGSRPMRINKKNIDKIIEAFEEAKRIAEELERELLD